MNGALGADSSEGQRTEGGGGADAEHRAATDGGDRCRKGSWPVKGPCAGHVAARGATGLHVSRGHGNGVDRLGKPSRVVTRLPAVSPVEKCLCYGLPKGFTALALMLPINGYRGDRLTIVGICNQTIS